MIVNTYVGTHVLHHLLMKERSVFHAFSSSLFFVFEVRYEGDLGVKDCKIRYPALAFSFLLAFSVMLSCYLIVTARYACAHERKSFSSCLIERARWSLAVFPRHTVLRTEFPCVE